MGKRRIFGPWCEWRDGMLLGLLSSTYSTVVVQLMAREIGRDPNNDWMIVGTVPLRARALGRRQPSTGVAAGIAAHQFADWFWATLFGGVLLWRVPRERRKAAICAAAVPWAFATAGAEYYLALPWLQPTLRMQVPYWTAAGVHTYSAAAYPLLLLVQGTDKKAGRRAAMALAANLVVLGWWHRRSTKGKDVGAPWLSARDRRRDREWIYRMSGHHQVGLRLAELAADRARDGHLRNLGELMAAEHAGQLRIMGDWHRSWFDGDVPPLSGHDRAEMPSMPPPEAVDRLATLDGDQFDRTFVDLMVPHHQGAIQMSEHLLGRRSDPRLKALAAAIVHSQRGQVAVMEDTRPLLDRGGAPR